jgi:hypothetical protein
MMATASSSGFQGTAVNVSEQTTMEKIAKKVSKKQGTERNKGTTL